MSSVEINGQVIPLKNNAYCGFIYRDLFESDILADRELFLKEIKEGKVNHKILLQMFYCFAKLANGDISPFADFCQSIDVDVTEFEKIALPVCISLIVKDGKTMIKPKFKLEKVVGKTAYEDVVKAALNMGISLTDLERLPTGQLVDILTAKRNDIERAKKPKKIYATTAADLAKF